MVTGLQGDYYYYQKNYIRLVAQMDEQSLKAIRILAIQKEMPIIQLVQVALNDFVDHPETLIPEFLPESNGSSLKTFIPKELQKKVKIIALEKFGRKFGALIGAVLSRWAKEHSNEAESIETKEGPAQEFVDKVQKLQDVKADAPETVPVAEGPF